MAIHGCCMRAYQGVSSIDIVEAFDFATHRPLRLGREALVISIVVAQVIEDSVSSKKILKYRCKCRASVCFIWEAQWVSKSVQSMNSDRIHA